ncbi:MAG: limonene-1,2-epoxide hydrolase family protein [Ilumatobacteraceae bacterium]
MPAAPTSTITDPGEFVTRFIENIEQFHFSDAMAMVADDCEYDNVPITKVFGREAMTQILSDFIAAATKVEWLIHHQVSSGDMNHGVVMNERTDRFEIDGRWIEIDIAGLFVVSDGKIALWRDYFDRESFTKALANK